MGRLPYQGTFQIDTAVVVTLDSNGSGTVTAGPGAARERWSISNISVNSDSALVPQVLIYRNSAIKSNFVTGSFSGQLDVDSSSNIQLRPGEKVVAVWSGGTPGATATVRFEGEKILI